MNFENAALLVRFNTVKKMRIMCNVWRTANESYPPILIAILLSYMILMAVIAVGRFKGTKFQKTLISLAKSKHEAEMLKITSACTCSAYEVPTYSKRTCM